jgi:hypothetical protein
VEDIIPSPAEPDIPLPPPSKSPVDILEADKGTPDNHVPRDSRLIRLTGVHPFNVEPPLTDLFKEGMPVPNNLRTGSKTKCTRLSYISGIILCAKPRTSTPSE